MSVYPPPDGFHYGAMPTFATKAELADYLGSQAGELEKLAAAEGDARLVEELARRFAAVAHEHELSVVAARFQRLITGPAERMANSG